MRTIISLLLLIAAAAPTRAAGDDAFRFFQTEGENVTALRRVKGAGEAPAAVDVITREEIEASGAVDFCDLLRFRPGLDVIDGRNTGGSNRCVISIRGMARDQVRELLVLIDGRSVYSPMSGVNLWEQLPVQLQDVERIEIVRGPNAALYGSGAGLGVINIITRLPKQRTAFSAKGTGGSLESAYSEEAFDDARGGFSYRLSHSFRQEDGYPTVTGRPSNDFLHSQKASATARWQPSNSTSLDVYAGGSWDTFGLPTGFGFPTGNDPQGRARSHFETARLSHSLDVDNVLELDLTRNEQQTFINPDANNNPEPVKFYEYTVEALHSFGWWDEKAHTTWGGSFKYSVSDSNYLFGNSSVVVNRALRGYVHETLRFAPKWSLVGGVSLEAPYYVGTRHADYQAALLYDVLDGHVLRAGYSMAHTNPGFADAYPSYSPQAGVVQLVPDPSVKSYELQNYELGYRGEYLDKRLTLGSSLYYMKIRDHVNIDQIAGNANTFTFPLVMQFDNTNYLIARGAELEGKLRWSPGRSAYVNYSQEVVTDRDGHTLYIKTTPKHIVNLGFIADLGAGFTASANAGWKGGYLGDSISGTNQVDIPPFWRLDARLAYSPTRWLELFVSGTNLLTPRHVEFVDGLTVPRRWFGGAKVRF